MCRAFQNSLPLDTQQAACCLENSRGELPLPSELLAVRLARLRPRPIRSGSPGPSPANPFGLKTPDYHLAASAPDRRCGRGNLRVCR